MDDLSLETVLQFLISGGGRVANRKLVTRFKDYLNHPVNKAANREKFKEYIDELAVIKVEEGEKILVLKKNYRQSSDTQQSTVTTSASAANDSVNAYSEQVDVSGASGEMDVDSPDGGMVSKAKIDETMEVTMRRTDRVALSSKTLEDNTSLSSVTGSTASLTSAGSQKSLASSTSGVASMDDDSNTAVISVKDKIKNLNRNISDSDLVRIKPGGSTGGMKKIHKHAAGEDDNSESYSALDAEQKDWLVVCSSSDYHDMNKLLSKNPGLAKLKDVTNAGEDDNSESYSALDAEQKDWLVVCSSSDYHDMNKLLSKNPGLAKLKDVTNTALHWAAKSGKSEVIKLLANKPGMRVDQRSGYTALHLAAMHGHQHIMELLVQTYKADANLRDFSGRKAKQYLKNSSSLKAQRTGMSMSESFARSSIRKSNRNKGVSSLLQAVSSVARQPLLNLSALTEAMADETDGVLKSSAANAGPSPVSGPRKLPQDENMMPPPSDDVITRRRHSSAKSRSPSQERSSSSRSTNNENLNMMKSGSEPVLDKMSMDTGL